MRYFGRRAQRKLNAHASKLAGIKRRSCSTGGCAAVVLIGLIAHNASCSALSILGAVVRYFKRSYQKVLTLKVPCGILRLSHTRLSNQMITQRPTVLDPSLSALTNGLACLQATEKLELTEKARGAARLRPRFVRCFGLVRACRASNREAAHKVHKTVRCREANPVEFNLHAVFDNFFSILHTSWSEIPHFAD
jgi:hypothetical protein